MCGGWEAGGGGRGDGDGAGVRVLVEGGERGGGPENEEGRPSARRVG